MKKLIKSTIICGLLVTTLLTSNIVTYAKEGNLTVNKNEQIKDEVIIKVTKEFDGRINEELKNLGVVLLDKIFEVDDAVMYVLKTEGETENIINKLEKLDYVEYAEYNQMVSASKDVNTLDVNEQIKDEENSENAEQSNFPVNSVLIGSGIVVVILGVALYLNKRK